MKLADLASIFNKVQTSLHTHQQWLSETLKHYDSIAKGLRVVHTSPPLASYVFVVNGEIAAATQDKLKGALKTLYQGYDGFQPSSDKDYDRERKLIARIKKQLGQNAVQVIDKLR